MNFCLVFTFFVLFSTSLAHNILFLEEDPKCVDQEVDVTWPYPGDCTKYYECYRGEKFVRDCPDGTWFHPKYLECTFPGDYCDANPTTTLSSKTTTTSTSTTSDPIDGKDPRCVDDTETTYWPHPKYCHIYIECYRGNSYEMICPRGLFYSEKLQECVDAHLSECCVSPIDCV